MTFPGNKNNLAAMYIVQLKNKHRKYKIQIIKKSLEQFYTPKTIYQAGDQSKTLSNIYWMDAFFGLIFCESAKDHFLVTSSKIQIQIIISQAIFDATNTTRERRATVYERIVHQHGLKCMFLESICNRWVLFNHTFNCNIGSLCFREMSLRWHSGWQAVKSVAKVEKLSKWTSIGSDFREIAHRALFKSWQ